MSTIGGGQSNATNGSYPTISGGYDNAATNTGAAVGGGRTNEASGAYATIPGGYDNTALGDYSLAAGRRAQANHQGAFVWADSTNADFASTGNDQFLVRAAGGVVFTSTNGALRLEADATSPNLIAGYSGNSVTSGVYGGTVGGGGQNGSVNSVTDNYGTVAGGRYNRAGDNAGVTTDAPYAAVGGGYFNTATDDYATVGGGYSNDASGNSATIAGGYNNTASNSSTTVGGGSGNTASGNIATVTGGAGNNAVGQYSAIGGGYNNTAGAGFYATVAGGNSNSATGWGSMIPGGYSNAATGTTGFAAGYRAKSNHDGAFVWADFTAADINSSGDDQFIVRANGGIWFGKATTDLTATIGAGVFISTSTGAYLSTGGNWTNASDRELKENFVPVDGQEVLARLAEMPIQTWNYKAEDPSVRHMGPVAQDFYAAFGLGNNETSISTVDADGVALAAIQALYEENQALEEENAAMQQCLDDMEARLTALEAQMNGNNPSLTSLGWGAPGLMLAGLAVGLLVKRKGGGR
jgi:hypothetical protein